MIAAAGLFVAPGAALWETIAAPARNQNAGAIGGDKPPHFMITQRFRITAFIVGISSSRNVSE